VAAASAALIGTLAAVLPAGVASADVTPGSPTTAQLNPLTNVCSQNGSTDCWRFISLVDDGTGSLGTTPQVTGGKLVLNPASQAYSAAGAWFNRPVVMTGNAIEASFIAYLDSGADPTTHQDGLAFALIEGQADPSTPSGQLAGGNNHPAPVPFDPTPADATHPLATEYGAGDGGLGFSGYDGDVQNSNGDGQKNLGVALLTSADSGTNFNDSLVGLLRGRKFESVVTDPNPHDRTGRWYAGGPVTVAPSIYGPTADSRPVAMNVQIYPTATAGIFHARVLVDGALKVESDVELPPVVYLGFTSGAGQVPQRHAISDVTIKYGTPAPPPPPPPPPPPVPGGAPYNAVAPARILDTRKSGGAIGPNAVRSVKVTGAMGVPEGAGAVVMNVTVTEPTSEGYITVYPSGTPAPTASSLNFVAGQNIANMVTAKVGTGGQVDIYNYAGDTQVLFDVVGWFPASLSSASASTLSAQAGEGGEFVPLVPDRILDTRLGVGATAAPLSPNSSLDLRVTGKGGVPDTGVAAVVLNLTGTNTTAPGYLTAWPTGSTRQETSNLNFGPGQSVPNLAVVPVGTGGQVSIYNFDGATDVLADVVGYYTTPGVSAGGGLFHAMAPFRFLDTRQTGTALGTAATTALAIANQHGVPADAVGVVMNVTATNTSEAGFLTVYPAGATQPGTSSLNFVPGQTVPNLVMSKLGGGAVNIFNYSGNTDVVVDVVGWYGPT